MLQPHSRRTSFRRAPSPSDDSCIAGTTTGQQLSYDAEGRLSAWQNVPAANPTASTTFRYDGEGARGGLSAQIHRRARFLMV